MVAADQIELEVASGEALGIIGPNGAGKTTLFNLIAGGISPDAGTIKLDGRDITAARPHERCGAGIARSYQIPRPFENLTVFENLLVAAVHGRRKTEAEATQLCADILTRLRLIARANQPAGSLTLLERKRLELARALATAPRLLLLDEIAGGLTEKRMQATRRRRIRAALDRRHDCLDRACPPCRPRRRRPNDGSQLRQEDRRRQANDGYEGARRPTNLYRDRGMRPKWHYWKRRASQRSTATFRRSTASTRCFGEDGRHHRGQRRG